MGRIPPDKAKTTELDQISCLTVKNRSCSQLLQFAAKRTMRVIYDLQKQDRKSLWGNFMKPCHDPLGGASVDVCALP